MRYLQLNMLFYLVVNLTTLGLSQSVAIDYSRPELLDAQVLVTKALANAPKLQYQNAYIAEQNQAVKVQKLEWTEHIYANTVGFLGTSNIAAYNNTANAEYLVNTARNDLNYSISISARLPLSDAVKRPQETKLLKLRVLKAEAEKDMFEQEIIAQVTLALDNLKMASYNVGTRAANYEANKLAFDIAEVSFRNAQTSSSEYAMILGRKVQAEEEFQKARSIVALYLHQLQILVGE